MAGNRNTMLFIGEQWLGSNSRSLAMAFRKTGWLVNTIDPMHYVPKGSTFVARVARRLLTPLYKASFNTAIVQDTTALQPSVVFVYKGTYINPATLVALRAKQIPLLMYYPDITGQMHEKEIVGCIPFYDQIFTAKSFGISDMQKLGARETHLVLHGSDTDVHRPLDSNTLPTDWRCDVSFIGTWSPHKERLLAGLIDRLPNITLRIWGAQWAKATSRNLAPHIMNCTVTGDLYAAASQSSKINLGLLLEQRFGASSGDLTTARTFEVPGCRSFMLHQRTDELLTCFEEGKEVECFGDVDELVDKVKYYLQNDSERLAIAAAGYKRCMQNHCYEHRAEEITQLFRTTLSK